MRDVAVPALVGADVETGCLLSWLPDIAIEVPLPPHPAVRRREDQLAVGTVQVDLRFQHPGQGRWDRHRPTGALLAVVGLGALEDDSLVRRAADLKGLAVEVLRS